MRAVLYLDLWRESGYKKNKKQRVRRRFCVRQAREPMRARASGCSGRFLRCLSYRDNRSTFNMGPQMKRSILILTITIISFIQATPAPALSQKSISAKSAIVMDDA